MSKLFAPLLIAGMVLYSFVASAKQFIKGWTFKINKIQIDTTKTAELMLEGVAIKINLIFNNPSAFEVKIKSLELKTYFQNKILSSSVSTNVIEIKPKSKVNQHVILKKIEAARQWCDEHAAVFEVITEVELKQLGCL